MSRSEYPLSAGRRLGLGLAGLGLVAVGTLGLLAVVPATARAGAGQAGVGSDGDNHAVMHEMMDAMHGERTAERMHEIEGADEMMDQCAGMMDAMGGMSNMMRGMSNGGMMDGGDSGMRDVTER